MVRLLRGETVAPPDSGVNRWQEPILALRPGPTVISRVRTYRRRHGGLEARGRTWSVCLCVQEPEPVRFCYATGEFFPSVPLCSPRIPDQ